MVRLDRRLDALASGTCLDELVDLPLAAPATTSTGREVLLRPKWPPRGVACSSVSSVRRSSPVAWMHKPRVVAAAAPAVEEPVPEDEATARGLNDPARGLRLCSRGIRADSAEHRICRKGDAHGLRKVSMEEPGGG
jgi:hypothetical protein